MNAFVSSGCSIFVSSADQEPGICRVAILTLALGIGANTAIFSVLDSILLQPLPFPHANRLMQIAGERISPATPRDGFANIRRRAHSFSSVSGYTLNAEYNVSTAGAPDRAFGSAVTTNLFDTLAVRPVLGRFFSPAEAEMGQDRVIVLSHGYWQQHFGSDPDVLGKNILLDGVNRQVIGVAPEGIQFPDSETQFWVPVSFKAGDIL